MNAFTPIESENRLAEMLRHGVEIARSSGRLARLRQEAGRHPFLFYIAGVTAAAAIYFFVLAAPLYTADVQFAVRGRQQAVASPLLSMLGGGGGGGGAAMTDTPLLQNYVQSQSMLEKLDGQVSLRQEYSAFRPDFLYHLANGASARQFLDFYNDMVTLDLDGMSGVMKLHVRAFSPGSANATARAVLMQSEIFVNDLSRQMLAESTRAARHDLALAQQADLQARLAVSNFQSRSGNLDPGSYGSTAGGAIFGVEASIGQLRAQLASMMTYSTAASPQVRQVQAQIADLQRQEAQLKQKLVGQNNGSSIVNQLGTFQSLAIRQTYAGQRVTSVQAQLDQAMSTAAQKQEFLVLISGPNLPDSPTPRAWWGLATVVTIATFLYAAGRLALASIRDHQM